MQNPTFNPNLQTMAPGDYLDHFEVDLLEYPSAEIYIYYISTKVDETVQLKSGN